MGVNPALQAIRRPQILEAALRMIAEHGIQNTTLDMVAKEAGMSKGGVVHYFPTKEILIKDAMKDFYESIFEQGRENRDQFTDPLDKMLSFTWIYDRENPDLHVGYRLLFAFMAQASRDEEYRQAFHDWVEHWVELLKTAIEEGVEQGIFHVDDPANTARTVSAIYQGIATRFYLDRDTHSTEWAVKSLKRAVRLFLTGDREQAE